MRIHILFALTILFLTGSGVSIFADTTSAMKEKALPAPTFNSTKILHDQYIFRLGVFDQKGLLAPPQRSTFEFAPPAPSFNDTSSAVKWLIDGYGGANAGYPVNVLHIATKVAGAVRRIFHTSDQH